MENTKMTNLVAMDYVIENFGADMPKEVLEKVTNMRNSLVKKSANRKPTATQIANEGLKDRILEVLLSNDTPMTITEIMKSSAEFDGLSNQKVTSLVTQLKNSGMVEKIVDGKKSTFKAV